MLYGLYMGTPGTTIGFVNGLHISDLKCTGSIHCWYTDAGTAGQINSNIASPASAEAGAHGTNVALDGFYGTGSGTAIISGNQWFGNMWDYNVGSAHPFVQATTAARSNMFEGEMDGTPGDVTGGNYTRMDPLYGIYKYTSYVKYGGYYSPLNIISTAGRINFTTNTLNYIRSDGSNLYYASNGGSHFFYGAGGGGTFYRAAITNSGNLQFQRTSGGFYGELTTVSGFSAVRNFIFPDASGGLVYTNSSIPLGVQSCTTSNIKPDTTAGATATGTCTIGVSATGHAGTAAATDGSVQGIVIPQVSVNGTTATVTLTTVIAGVPIAKSYNVIVF